MTKVHILDPRLVEQTLNARCRTMQRRGSTIVDFAYCWFEIGFGDEKLFFSFSDREPNSIHLSFKLPHGCSIFFDPITRVAYDIENHVLIQESHTPSHVSILSIYAHGRFELTTGIDALRYEGTGYDEQYREVTEKHDRRLQELRTMPYPDYLLTPEWENLRKLQLARSGYRCQVCNARQVQLQVHHRTYERRGNEAPGDLLTLCQNCHDLFHKSARLATEDAEKEVK